MELKLVVGSKEIVIVLRRKGIALAGVTIVVWVEANNLVPTSFHRHEIKILNGWCWRSWLFAELVRSTDQNGNLNTRVVFNSAFQQVIQVLLTV